MLRREPFVKKNKKSITIHHYFTEAPLIAPPLPPTPPPLPPTPPLDESTLAIVYMRQEVAALPHPTAFTDCLAFTKMTPCGGGGGGGDGQVHPDICLISMCRP